MAPVVKSSLVVGLAVCWVALILDTAIGFLPSRPDSCAFIIAQGFLVPALMLQFNKREKFGQLELFLKSAAAGATIVWVVLFHFGGFRAAAMAS